MRTTLFVLLSTSLVVSGSSAAETTPSVSQVLRIIIKRSDDLMRRSLIVTAGAEFVKRSPTFSDLLRGLRDARHVLLYLQFAQLRPPPPSGRTRFDVALTGVVVGFIEIDAGPTFPLSRHGAVVAHELAHAYEVSCLRDIRTTEELLERLRARAGPDGGGTSTETPFATAVEKAVLDEWSGARTASQLPALSEKYDLSACLSPAQR